MGLERRLGAAEGGGGDEKERAAGSPLGTCERERCALGRRGVQAIDQPLGLASDPFPLSLLSVIITLRINGIEGLL